MPEVKHLEGVSDIKGSEIEPVNIITFGSPCQDMSIAGKRAGLNGSRSNLFYEAIRIIKEIFEIKGYQIDAPRPNRWQNAGLIMALDRAIRCGNQNTESVYDSRGILFM